MLMDKDKLNEILEKHELWLRGEPNGERVDLRGADLIKANLSYANLTGVDLSGVDLTGAYLRGANLSGVDLTGAYLRGVNSGRIYGQRVISVQVDTSRENNPISYWVDLGIWTTGYFQGSLDQLKESIEEMHKDNEFLKSRYYRVIDFILSEAEQDKLKGEEDKKEYGISLDDFKKIEVKD